MELLREAVDSTEDPRKFIPHSLKLFAGGRLLVKVADDHFHNTKAYSTAMGQITPTLADLKVAAANLDPTSDLLPVVQCMDKLNRNLPLAPASQIEHASVILADDLRNMLDMVHRSCLEAIRSLFQGMLGGDDGALERDLEKFNEQRVADKIDHVLALTVHLELAVGVCTGKFRQTQKRLRQIPPPGCKMIVQHGQVDGSDRLVAALSQASCLQAGVGAS